MKKIALALCVLLVSVSVFGCSSRHEDRELSAYETYLAVSDVMKDVKSYESTVTGTLNMVTSDDQSMLMDIQSTSKQVQNDEGDIGVEAKVKMSSNGDEMDTVCYYKDGYYYVDSMGNKSKIQMSIQDFYAQIAGSSALTFSEEDVIDSSMESSENGKMVVFTLKGDSVGAMVSGMLAALTKTVDNQQLEIKFSDVNYVLHIDTQNMITGFDTQMVMEMTDGEDSITIDTLTNSTLSNQNNTTVTFPDDLDTYQEVQM